MNLLEKEIKIGIIFTIIIDLAIETWYAIVHTHTITNILTPRAVSRYFALSPSLSLLLNYFLTLSK